MNIINRNFFRLLRSGAFHTTERLEPMSPFKWRRLLQIAEVQEVMPYVSEGMSRLATDPALAASGLPHPATDDAEPILTAEAYAQTVADENPQLSNIFLKWRMRKMMERQEQSPDHTPQTTRMMLIIIHNASQTLTRGITLRPIIEAGRYLRAQGQNVDFVSIDRWLSQLGMQRMASLQGSILTDFFSFEADEIPFLARPERSAARLMERSLTHTAADTAENWHFRMRTNGMVENNSKVLRRNLRRSLRYLRYNPIETTSNFMANFARSLSEIEE